MSPAQEVQPGPGNSLAQRVPRGWHMRTETAELIGKSYDTVRRWHEEGVYEPSGWMQAGEVKVWLYSDADIEYMKKLSAKIQPGPKPKEEE